VPRYLLNRSNQTSEGSSINSIPQFAAIVLSTVFVSQIEELCFVEGELRSLAFPPSLPFFSTFRHNQRRSMRNPQNWTSNSLVFPWKEEEERGCDAVMPV
jgi:hypothetical protein